MCYKSDNGTCYIIQQLLLEPQLHLVEPGAMFRCKVEHMLMARITQERPPLHSSAQVRGHTGHFAPLSNRTADIKAPVRVEIINYPVVALHIGQLGDNMGQMG